MKRRWRVVLLRAKGEILGEVEAPDAEAATAAAALQFDLDDVQRNRIRCRSTPSVPLRRASYDDSADLPLGLNDLEATCSPAPRKTHQRASLSDGGQIGRKGARARWQRRRKPRVAYQRP